MITFNEIQSAIENDLKNFLASDESIFRKGYFEIFEYQFGWSDRQILSKGKRIRPLILLLSCDAVGGDWKKALPAASAIEIMHNFSLIHDDIQDKSLLRRGKDTVWVKWGEPLAINAGDALLAFSLLSPSRLAHNYPDKVINQVNLWLSGACIDLTKGQYMDIQFEDLKNVDLDLYFEMIEGKTCSLIKCAMQMGAYLGGANSEQVELFKKCGHFLGQAFQVQDDLLGIWGSNEELGKSVESDLITRKKSYPIILGLNKKKEFYDLWNSTGIITTSMIPGLIRALEQDGVKEDTERLADELFQKTFNILDSLNSIPFKNESMKLLNTVLRGLIGRKK